MRPSILQTRTISDEYIYITMNEHTLLNMGFFNNHKLTYTKPRETSNVIFSLTTIPIRFIHVQFEKTIESLYNQIHKAKYIIIHL
jgi:hypothetical protein